MRRIILSACLMVFSTILLSSDIAQRKEQEALRYAVLHQEMSLCDLLSAIHNSGGNADSLRTVYEKARSQNTPLKELSQINEQLIKDATKKLKEIVGSNHQPTLIEKLYR